jgi:hypothetical protein
LFLKSLQLYQRLCVQVLAARHFPADGTIAVEEKTKSEKLLFPGKT